MTRDIQETLLQLFESVRRDPDTLPIVPLDAWQEGSSEWRLLESFRGMVGQMQERIHQLKQAEDQLREQEELYHSAFEATHDGFLIGNLDGSIVEANPAACEMYGYTHEEMIRLTGFHLIHPDSYPQLEERMAQPSSQGTRWQFVALRKDGTTFHSEGHVSTFIYKGKPHLLSVGRDVTERVEAERQLREKEEQYRNIFEATGDGLFVIDLDGFVVEANTAACRQLGYRYEEMIGLHRSAIVHPDYHSLVPEYLQVIQTGDQFQGRAIDMRKDGTTFPVEVLGRAFTYKGRPHTLSVVRDITAQAEAEKQLREREEQYRSVFEATTDGLFITDFEDGHLVEVNPAAFKMHGYGYQEFIALHPTAFIHPDSHHLFIEYLQTVKAGGQFHAQAIDVRKDGTTFPVEVYGTTFIYKGKPHVLGIVRDITEQVKAEQQLREREEQYRSVFETTYDGLVIFDLESGRYVEGNPAFCRMFGYTHEELIGIHSDDLAAPVDPHRAGEVFEMLKMEQGYQAAVGLGLRKDGSRFYMESQGATFTYRGKTHSLAVIRDITEQVQAQQLLEQRVEERTRELASLLDISHTMASTLQLEPLVDLILNRLKTMVKCTGASILTLEGDKVVILDIRNPTPEEQLMQLRFSPQRLGSIWKAMDARELVLLPDARGESPMAQALREAMGELMDTRLRYVRACLFVPLTLKDRMIGMLVLAASEPDAFTSHHATLALTIANQAAIAIENVRLYTQAQDLAALEERQKLARELHDSVSQALYGISLGAHAARTALEREPDHLAEPLDYILTLAEAALTEMRALIFELRPESLETEGLVAALSRQAATMQARHHIGVSTALCDEPALSLRAKQELYRIAQEALHNIVKHAHASEVALCLEQTGDRIILEIRDDGAGFDVTGSFPGHLGLQSMRERAVRLGGTFEVESGPGAGTRVRVRVPV